MLRESKSTNTEQPFGDYIEEVREFLTSRDVPFGNAADLPPFAERLASDESFSEEMGSIVRSIVYRESERIGRGELLELLAAAVGGENVDGAGPATQPAIRKIFLALNSAVRQQRPSFVPEPDDTAPITAGDLLAAAEVSRELQARAAVPAVSPPAQTEHPEPSIRPHWEAYEPLLPQLPDLPEPTDSVSSAELAPKEYSQGQGEEPEAAPTAVPRPKAEPPAPNGDARPGELFQATHRTDTQANAATNPNAESAPRKRSDSRPWLVPAVAVGLAVLGAGVYVARSYLPHSAATPSRAAATEPAHHGAAEACVAPMSAGASRSGLEERSRWAHNLLDQKLYSSALPELQEIARQDPGYPGVRLDESDALLKLHKPEQARDAIDRQISISQCLASLPRPALELYCSSHYPASTAGGCRAQISHVQQQAELQAALVHLELGHKVEPDLTSAEAIAALADEAADPGATSHLAKAGKTHTAKPRHVEPLPPATEEDTEQPLLPKPAPVHATGQKQDDQGKDPNSVQGTVPRASQKPE